MKLKFKEVVLDPTSYWGETFDEVCYEVGKLGDELNCKVTFTFNNKTCTYDPIEKKFHIK